MEGYDSNLAERFVIARPLGDVQVAEFTRSGLILSGDGGAIMKTIPNVPIVSTGTYHLAGNPYQPDETTFTTEDLADAVAAVQDPAVKLPRLKLGHTSDWGDAEPNFGLIANMHLSENGETIYGDYTGTPAWLADVLPMAYPNRSVEAFFNVETATGNKYRMVITAVALLGVQLPGVATLEDLAGLWTAELPEGVTIDGEDPATVAANLREEDNVGLFKRGAAQAAGTNVEVVRRAFYEEWAIGDQYYWWIREMFIDPNELIVDNGDGDLFRMSYDIKGEAIDFGEPAAVKVEYVAATAGDKPGDLRVSRPDGTLVAVFASASDSRPAEHDRKEPDMKLTEDQLKRLGLPPDASEEDQQKALDAHVDSLPEEPETPDGDETETGEGDGTETGDGEGEPQGTATPEPVAASNGAVTVDADTLARLEEGSKLGREAHAREAKRDRDTIIDTAIKAGKFAPSRKEHWEKAYDADPEGAKAAIESLADNLVPVDETGSAPADGDLAAAEATAHRAWLSPAEVARAEGKTQVGAPGTIMQEA